MSENDSHKMFEVLKQAFGEAYATALYNGKVNQLAANMMGGDGSDRVHPAGMDNAVELFKLFACDTDATVQWFIGRGFPIQGTREEKITWHENNWEHVRKELKLKGLFEDDDSDQPLDSRRKKPSTE